MARKKIYVDLDFMGNRASNLVLDYLPEDPTPGYHGQLYVNSETQRLRINIRGTWVELAKMTDLDDMEEDLRKIKSDKFVSPSEKVRLRDQLKDIEEEYKEITSEAFRYGLDSSVYNEAYRKAVAALRKYTEDSPDYIPIDGDFDDIAAYYPARTAIKEILAEKIKEDLDGTRDQIEALQAQVDGVVESFSGQGAPTLSNYPADEWTTDEERKRHARDIYTDITPYVDDETTPTSGHAWKWYYNGPADYGWVEIADSEAVKAMVLARMSVLDTDVLFVQTSSQTLSPALPIINESGIITNPNGWSTDAPEWQRDKYIWQTTYVRKGDGAASFSKPTCISGRNGTDGVPGAPGKDGQTTYTWIRYADNAQGGGISNDPTGKEYIGFAYNKTTSAESDSPSDYTWSLIKGTDGVPGAPGKDGQTTYTWIKYSDNADGTGMYDIPKSTTKYIGIAVNKTSQAESSDKTDYTWSLSKGADGTSVTITSQETTYQASNSGTSVPTGEWAADIPEVASGQYLWTRTVVNYSTGISTMSYSVSHQGANGKDGESVTVTSTETKYAKGDYPSQPADSLFTLESVGALTKGQYLWTRTIVNYSDGATTKSYTAAYIGSDGSNGAPGAAGADGKTSYTHFAYASGITGDLPHPSAVAGFSTTSFAGAKYIGVCSNFTAADPTTHAPYEWSEYKGADGNDGVGVASITEQYYLSTSRTQLNGGSWSDERPDWVAGRYYWTRSKITYTDGRVEYTGEVCATGEQGDQGQKGDSTYLLDINNEAIGIACNANGSIVGSFPFTYARVWKGSSEISSGVKYTIYDTTGIDASINQSGVLTMSAMTADTARVVVQAAVDGLALRASISIYKVIPGHDGTNGSDGQPGKDGTDGKDGSDGKDARVYSILTSVDNVTRKIDGTLSASSVTCTKYLTVGASGTTTTTEKYLYAYRVLLTGVAEAASLIAGPPAVSGSVTITDKTAAVVFELRDSSSSSAAVLDRERVPVLADSGELQERLTDIEYLKKIFPEGTFVSVGAIIAKLLGVSGDENEIEAGINGSDLGKDATHGKILIFAGATSVQDLANAVTIIYKDGTIKTKKLEALAGSFAGTLEAVSGSFTSLQCVNAAGEVVGTLRFGTEGDITHENCDWRAQGTMNGRSLRYYAQDVWVRDQLGAYSRTAVVIEGTTAKYYTKGLYSSSYVSITLTSKTTTTSNASSSGLIYYDVKLYSPETASSATFDASGFPVDLVIIKKSGTASSGAIRYNFICVPGKKFSVINTNDGNNYVYFYSNGSPYQLYGGHAAEMVNVGYNNLIPTVSSLKLGAGLMILSDFDNNW